MPQASSDPRPKVFISHQWRDKQLADELADNLERFANVWLDYRNLRPGDAIQPIIDKVLEGIDIVLVIWTENSQKSKGVEAEIITSTKLGLRIVPCFFHFDEDGNHKPPISGPLSDFLGVDFYHYGTGLNQIINLIMEIQSKQLPPEVNISSSPKMRMVSQVKNYLNYLANYRAAHGVQDKRSYWIGKIINELETYFRETGDLTYADKLLEAARVGAVNDPEGLGALASSLENLLRQPSSDATNSLQQPGAFQKSRIQFQPDELSQRIMTIAPPGTADQLLSQVHTYLEAAPQVLQVMGSYAQSIGTSTGLQVVAYLNSYLENPDDLISDNRGLYGQVDDAWLIINTAFRLIESGLLPANLIPVDWNTIVAADHVIQSILPEDVLNTLTSIVFQMLQLIAAEINAYQPWFTPTGNRYNPTMPAPRQAGGFWEDHINEKLLGTGLSV